MDTSLRINLIEKIFKHLNSLNIPLVVKDMPLDEFGFPEGSSLLLIQEENYFLDRLRNGTDEQILRLARHYGVLGEDANQGDDSMWEHSNLRVFLSFISKDGDFAEELKRRLDAVGICSFLSHRDIKPNEEWVAVIEKALDSCHALVALMTPEYNKSEWTDQEVGWAYGRGVPVIPVRLGLDPYGFIGKIQAVRVNDRIQIPRVIQVRTAIMDALWKDKRCHPNIGRSVVYALAESKSWDQTRLLYPYVTKIDYWENDMVSLLESAMKTNREIYEALLPHEMGGGWLIRDLEKLLDRAKPRQPVLRSSDVDDLPFE